MKLTFKISKEYILSQYSQIHIIEQYFPSGIVIGTKYTNPFRNDKHKGCYFAYDVNGNLKFYDWATEKVSYDCFDIVMLALNCSFEEALLAIVKNVKPSFVNITNEKKKELSEIKVRTCPFDKEDLDYWGQFDINEDILNYFNVRKCSRVWINGEIWTKGELDPVYRYKQKNQIKIYRPFAKKENKFRNNYYGGLVDGYLQLPYKGDVVFIQKAMKETMSMYANGYSAIGVRSETTLISQNLFNILQKRFQYIIPYMDNDET